MNIEKHPRCLILPDEEAGDEGEEDAGDQLEEAVEPHVHPVQHIVVRRKLELKIGNQCRMLTDILKIEAHLAFLYFFIHSYKTFVL